MQTQPKLLHLAVALVTVFAAFVLAAPVSAQQGIYRWVDDNGVVHFSDTPRDGAEEVEISPVQTFSAPAAATARPAAAEGEAAEPDALYDALEIVSPSEEETIWNTGGVITVSVSPQPALKPGHSLAIYYNGQLINGDQPRATSVQLSEVFRGEHTISAEIRSASGRVLKRADPVTFFYRQTSVRN